MNKKEYHEQLQDGIDEMEAKIERLREEISQLLKPCVAHNENDPSKKGLGSGSRI